MPTTPKTGLRAAYAETDLDMKGHKILNVDPSSAISGYSGFVGAGGYSGYSGYCGLSGYSGYSGVGLSGFSGFSGYSGRSGFSGSNPGASGFSGYSGPAGGASGFSGYSGYSAASPGSSGFSGYCGLSGYSGFSAASGYSGYSASSPGASGYSGFSGASGKSGYSGYSGSGDILQNSQSVDYTTVLGDDGKHILHPASDNNPRTFTIDSNANVAYAIGSCITFVNRINVVSIAITADTLRMANTSNTGTRTLAVNGIATALKIGTTEWIINGNGLT